MVTVELTVNSKSNHMCLLTLESATSNGVQSESCGTYFGFAKHCSRTAFRDCMFTGTSASLYSQEPNDGGGVSDTVKCTVGVQMFF